ncbi:MAG: hypothetical protein AB7J28_10345 [Hyphomonadaceae bacterium]
MRQLKVVSSVSGLAAVAEAPMPANEAVKRAIELRSGGRFVKLLDAETGAELDIETVKREVGAA